MRWVKRISVGLVAVLLLLGAAAALFVQSMFPRLDGTQQVHGLGAAVAVERDAADVTHIRAGSSQDAMFALGWVHAQERGWQLEFNRRVMHGELSELFGSATLDTDKLMRALDVKGTAARQYAALPAHAREALDRYSAGINAYHARGRQLSPEFVLLGTRPGGAGGIAWTPQDSVGWTLMMALDLGGNWGNEFARLSLSQPLDSEHLWQLMPAYPGEKPAASVDLPALYRSLGVFRQAAGAPQEAPAGKAISGAPETLRIAAPRSAALQAWSDAWVRDAGTNEGKGSNNWVIAGSRTKSGKPLLANDPHLGLSAPAIWYFAHLEAPAGQAADGTPLAAIDTVGATLPGLPFVVLGRTAGVAWGFTNTGPDVQDLYLEQIHPDDPAQYRTPDGWARFGVRTETIRVKGQPDVALQLRSTRHGPVLSDAQASHAQVIDTARYVLALRWSALDTDNQTVLAGLQTNQAQTVPELFAALAHYHSPMQSVVAADTQGRIGLKAAGRVPVRHADNDIRGVAPSPGWDARYDWQGWLPYDQTPQDDGAKGWIATANQRITAPDYPHFLTQDWALPYRYERIAKLIEATPLHDEESMRQLHADQHSEAALRLLPFIQQAAGSHALVPAAKDALARFTGAMDAEQPAPLILAAWTDELVRGVVAPRVGEARFAATYGKRDFRAGIEGILARNDAWWCQPLGCAGQASAALDRALERLQAQYGADVAQWRWGEAHPAVSAHHPFSSVAALAPYFNVSVPTGGDSYTVNVGQYDASKTAGPFVNRHAASLRAVYDLADLERSRFVYQTGQSGLVLSPRYRDMAEEWRQVAYRALQRQPGQVPHRMRLEPAR